jgi:hypothetical protein
VRKSLVIALALVAPFPLLALANRSLADVIARRAATALDRAIHSVSPKPAPEPHWTFVEPELEASELDPEIEPAKLVLAAKRIPQKGIRVRADAVLRLANSGTRPMGIPTPAHGARPAGLALVGVSGLGVGLIDGDVLTQAAGRPALSTADVIGVVIGSRAQHVPEICGRFWRKGEPWNLVVEQPYVAPRPVPAEANAEPIGAVALQSRARR